MARGITRRHCLSDRDVKGREAGPGPRNELEVVPKMRDNV